MASSKFKVCRRISENLWTYKTLTPKQAVIVWKFQKKAHRKQSDFATQLLHSTKLSLFYGRLPVKKMQPKQTSSYLDKTKRLLFCLETRLDVILVRLNIAPTLFNARQFIVHGKICVNSRVVNVPGLLLNNGDIISVVSEHFDFVKTTISQNQTNNRVYYHKPSHLEINYNTLNAIVLYEPSQIQFPFHIALDLLF